MKKNINDLWVVLTITLIIIFTWFFLYQKSSINTSDNNSYIINNINNNGNNINLEDWKEKQVNEYKFATNTEFWSWNIVEIDLVASENELELIPWVKTKMNTYNSGSLEPLEIRVKKWDKLIVNFKNNLSEWSTVHWHWVRLENSQDWVAWLNQDTVLPGNSFKYEFVLNDPGTYLFHPHDNHAEQIGRGLYWTLIVEDNNEPKYDKDITWVLKDYRIWRNWKLTDDFPNFHDSMHWWRLWNVVTINNIIKFKENVLEWETIRLRLANISNARIYNLDLSNFNAKVIATDDSLINNPHKINSLEVAPWERYDLEIKIPNITWELELYDNYFSWNSLIKLASFNVLWNSETPLSIETPVWKLPDWRDASYNNPDLVIDLWWMWVMWWDKGMMMWMRWQRWWTINDWIYPETNTPIKLKKWKMYIIRMVNNSRRDHPMHLHWDFFQVINVNWMKWENIWFKDTVNVKPLSYVDLAFIPTNAWEWAFHCHILEHADLGMFTTMIIEE